MRPFDPRLLRYSRSSRGFLILSVLIAAITTAATIGIALTLSRLIVNIFQGKSNLSHQDSTLTALALAFAVKALALGASQKVATSYSNRIRSELRNGTFHRIVGGDLDTLFSRGSASTSLLLTRGINDLDGYFTKFLPQLFIAAILPLFVGLTIVRYDFRSGLIIACTIPLIPLFGYMIGRFTGDSTERKLQTLHQLSTYFLDLLEGVTTLKVFGRSQKQSKNIAKIGNRYRSETLSVLKISFLSSLALELVATLSVALIAVSIGLRLVHGGMELRTGLLVLILSPEVYWPIRQVASRFHDVEDGIAVSDQIFTILDGENRSLGMNICEIQSVSWSDLIFEFEGRKVLHIPAGIISRGKVHGLIGPSGSGKSTLFAALLGYISPTAGEILITTEAGVLPLSEISLPSLRSRISWLPQEPHLLDGTIIEFLGVDSEAEAIDLLARVALPDSAITGGVHAEIGSMNDFLSYGQKRKLALARAINKDADLLLVDEPTASVDEESESVIRNLLTLNRDHQKIVFFASHRPGLIAGADNEIELQGSQ